MQRNAFIAQFEWMAASQPDAPAVQTDAGTISYRALNEAANRAAHDILRRRAADPTAITGLFLEPGIAYVAGLLGTAKTASAFLPLPPGLPERRLAAQLAKAVPREILTDRNHAGPLAEALARCGCTADIVVVDVEVNAGAAPPNPGIGIGPGDPCYVMFTSGSTGAPKAILGQQRGLSHFLRWEIATLGLDATCRCSWLAPPTFDVSLRDILVPLMAGGTLCIPDADTRVVPHRLIDWLASSQVRLVHIVPTMLRMVVRELERRSSPQTPFPALRHLLVAGEPLLAGDIAGWRKLAGSTTEVINLYGPSETTLAKLFHRVVELPDDPGKILPIGHPLPNTQVLILNGKRRCRPGEIGEIHISTPYRSLGYLGDPELTRACFIQNPTSSEPDDIVYKTGDLGRLLPDGAVECLGRIDTQVKINGVRIELAEIEAALREIAAIDQAVAAVHAGPDGQPIMVGYYTRRDGAADPLPPSTIQADLDRILPPAMQPQHYMRLSELPLTISGKVNRKALPQPDALVDLRIPFVAPQGQIEQAIANIWCELFGASRVSAIASFRDLGGDSLKAIRAVMRLWEQFGTEVPLKDFFEGSTIQKLAAFIVRQRQGDAAPPVIARLPDAASYPASFGQQRLWRLDRMGLATSAYNLSEAYLLEGELDVSALERALALLIARHESLRTTLRDIDGDVRQVVQDGSSWRMERHDLAARDDAEARAEQLAQADRDRPFDLANGPLLRVSLVRLPPAPDGRDRHVFLFSVHHIISDLWSLDVLVRELAQAYRDCRRGAAPAFAPLRLQYRDIVAWQNQRLTHGDVAASRDYWLARLRHPPRPLDLPTDRPRPTLQSYQGATARFRFGPELSAGLAALAAQGGVTTFVVLTALLKTLLHRYTGETDIAVGTTTAGRDHPAMAPLIGYLAATVVLRDELDPTIRFAELLGRVSRTVTEALAHQAYPFDALIGDLAIERDMSRSPLFDVMIVEQAFTGLDLALDGLVVSGFGPDNAWAFSRYDMVFHVQHADDGLVLDLNYNTDLFDTARIERCGAHLLQLAEDAAHAPETAIGDLPLLTAAERAVIARFEQGPALQRPQLTISAQFELAAQRFADRPALVETDSEISYRDLSALTHVLALHLAGAYEIAPGDRVAVLAERSIASVAAMLAIFEAAAVYVPIDAALPAARMAAMVRQAGCRLVLTDPMLDSALPPLGAPMAAIDELIAAATRASRGETRAGRARTNDVAYVIFTSGSTGEPRAVMVEHAGFVNMSLGQIEVLALDATDRVVQFASPSFDASLANMFMALFAGGAVLLPHAAVLQSLPLFLDYLAASRATTVTLPPTYLRALDRAWLGNVRTLITAGEAALSGDMVHYAGEIAVFNAYGPTEFSVCATMHRVASDRMPQRIPIGKPLPNTSIHILDDRLRRVPIGIDGEIHLGGSGLARGYQNDPAQTGKKFIVHAETGERLYCTGDRGRFLDDGNVDFLGRRDQQVKISGHRIELGEVEHAMRSVGWIRDAHVMVRARDDGSHALIGYYVREPAPELWPSIAEFFVYDDVTYGQMAGDEGRNARYRAAFARHLQGKVVVDIGTGPLAILARLAIEAGARKVYAIDLLEESATKARRKVAELGLADRIEVLQGDAARITLPETADWCISEIVGAIGGSEGAAAIIDGARRLLADPTNMLPRRSLTLIAAAHIDENIVIRSFSEIGAHYVERIFADVGRPFDLRLCIKNLPADALLSSEAPLEDLDFTRPAIGDHSHDILLHVTRAGRLTGFVAWLRLFVDDDLTIDILQSQASWLPVYFPALPDAVEVQAGDTIRLTIARSINYASRNPDFRISGVIERPGRDNVAVTWTSPHIADGFRQSPFYRRLFADGSIPRAAGHSAVSLRLALREQLAPYAVPAFLVEVDRIPMTINGKVDRAALPLPKLTAPLQQRAPRSEREHAVTETWQRVLGREVVGLDDDFFQFGGDSIHAIRIVSELRRRFWHAEVRSVFQNPTPGQLAATLVKVAAAEPHGPFSGELPLSPIQRWLFDHAPQQAAHFNQAVVIRHPVAFDVAAVSAALDALVRQHDALRMQFRGSFEAMTAFVAPSAQRASLQIVSDPAALPEAASRAHGSFVLQEGPLFKALLANGPVRGELVLIAHHAVVDTVSWRTLTEDFATAYAQAAQGSAIELGPLPASLAQHAAALQRLATATDWSRRLQYWRAIRAPSALPTDVDTSAAPLFGDIAQVSASLDSFDTRRLLMEAERAWNSGAEELLLAALGLAVGRVLGADAVLVTLERHGRDAPISGDPDFPDLGRTVGWFTNIFPFLLNCAPARPIATVIETLHAALHDVPDQGRSYGLLTRHPAGPRLPPLMGQIGFNYLGNFGASRTASGLAIDWDAPGPSVAAAMKRPHALDVLAMVVDGRLELSVDFDRQRYWRDTADRLLSAMIAALADITAATADQHHAGQRAQNFTQGRFSADQLDRLLADD